ncbi:ABC transporter ATP-binding protein [Conservatibacter flavescens]|uniref:ABC transporter ATP-binding protein n=1 Tax=Conservatibacter flavescens TaxID=28161 RepID=A0A2M8S4D8_9PAST|nr:ATP-binding cassette domain-containing protein [Conservatibacter flavescens]PJG86002.1 ABC transporter ATP-binding protein [Conservatibacter flavescens]
MDKLIRVTDLTVKTVKGECLVEPMSFSIGRGQNLTILGETGSGKSLLAQSIMGCLAPELTATGEINIEGEMKCQWGRQLAMLPQEPYRSLDPTMPIGKQIWESLYFVAGENKQIAQQKTQQKLTALGLNQFAQHYPHQISGGMAQRVAFAAAVSGGAYILIADEPTKGLDSHNKHAVIQMLQSISSQGGALLTITHDIDVAQQLGGDIMVMKQGKLLEQGKATQILSRPHSDYAKALIAAAPTRWPAQHKISYSDTNLLTVKELTLAREQHILFRGVNFSLKKGEILGVVGESGVGKSSLGDALCGLLAPKCGQITWHFLPQRHQVLKLYQDPPAAFAPNVPLHILLNDVIKRHQLDSQRIPYLLEQLNLNPDILQRTAENVSGGELQRVAILRALLFQPVLLFADEATSRLDPITQKDTLDLLVEQCRLTHCALILVSHDHDLIQHYCHQVIDLTAFREG